MTKEQWAALAAKILDALVLVLGIFMPEAFKEAIPYIIGVIEGISWLLIFFLFAPQTKAKIASLQTKVKQLSR